MNDESDPGQAALGALHGIDGPARLEPEVEQRIEAAMLTRFDELVADQTVAQPGERTGGPTVGWTAETAAETTVVALAPPPERVVARRRANRRAMVLASAAAVVAVIVGFAVIAGPDDAVAPSGPTPTPATATTTGEGGEDVAAAEQLAAFCTDHVVPVREAVDRWPRDGEASELRIEVVARIELSVDALARLPAPLGDRLADRAAELSAAAADARLAVMLARSDADDTVGTALDALFAALSDAAVEPIPGACEP